MNSVTLGEKAFKSMDLDLIVCQACGGQLEGRPAEAACKACHASYPVTDGILRMLNQSELTGAAAFERERRDQDAEAAAHATDDRTAETEATLKALGDGRAVLELGCGNGHFTSSLAARFRQVVAVDFSFESLRTISRSGHDNVLLVQADVTKLKVGPAGFTHCLSTLVSNLPTLEHRQAMYRLMSTALGVGGVCVFTTHHHDARSRLKGQPKESRYQHSNIFYKQFTEREIKQEVGGDFPTAKVTGICAAFPGLGKLTRLLGGGAARAVGRMPVIDLWSRLLLVRAVKA